MAFHAADARTGRAPGPTWAPFWSALVHVVRNAIDHAIESEEGGALRARAGHDPVRFVFPAKAFSRPSMLAAAQA